MKKLVILVIWLFGFLVFVGCGDNLAKTGKVEGVVTDEKTGFPIWNVTVSYSGNTIICKTTDGEGKYEIYLPEGKRDLTFIKEGYNSKTVQVTVIKDSTVTCNVALTPEGAIPEVARVEILPTAVTLKIGASQKFEVKAYDSNNTAITDFTPQLSLNPSSLGTIANDGTFTAKEEGGGTLTATVFGKSETASITVEGNYPSGPPHLVKTWGGMHWSSGIAVIGDTVYVPSREEASGERSTILMFDLNGTPKGKIGSSGTGPGQFGAVVGLCGTDFALYVPDNGNWRIQKFGPNGNFLMMFGSEALPPDYPAGKFCRVMCDVAVDSNGYIYTLEGSGDPEGAQRVQKWTANGEWVKAWGSYGRGQGQFYNCRGICVDNDNNILVADSENMRIQKFDSNGKFLMEWQTIDLVSDIAYSMSHNIYYVNSGAKITAYTKNGKLLFSWGPVFGYSLAVDQQGNVYYVEYDNDRVLKFSY